MGFVLKFFLLVLFLSSAELYLLIMVAARFSFITAFALCALTGLVGGAIVRRQGLQTLTEIRNSLSRGVFPPLEIISGLMLIVLGVLLMVPGFITDTLGMIMLIPAVRLAAARRVLSAITEAVRGSLSAGGGGMMFRWFAGGGGRGFTGGSGDSESRIIDVSPGREESLAEEGESQGD